MKNHHRGDVRVVRDLGRHLGLQGVRLPSSPPEKVFNKCVLAKIKIIKYTSNQGDGLGSK